MSTISLVTAIDNVGVAVVVLVYVKFRVCYLIPYTKMTLALEQFVFTVTPHNVNKLHRSTKINKKKTSLFSWKNI